MGVRLLPPLAAFLLFGAWALAPLQPAFAAEQPAYIAIGDSLAFGVGATNPAAGGYVALAYDGLLQDDDYAERGLELINLSNPGATSSDLLLPDGQLDKAVEEIVQRAEEGGEGTHVEIISVDIGGNDLLALAEADSPCVANTSSQSCLDAINETLSMLQDNLFATLTGLREAAPDARIFVLNLYNPYSGTGSDYELIANVGVQQVNGVIGAVASQPSLDATLVPIYDLFQGRGNQWIASDGIHPNDDGHRVMGEALMATIQERAFVLPEGLTVVPTVGPNPTPPASRDGSDGDTLLLVIVIPLAFLAGAVVSGVYFLARGRG